MGQEFGNNLAEQLLIFSEVIVRYWPEQHSSKAWLWREALFPRWLIHVADRLRAIAGRLQLVSQDCLGDLTTLWLASPRVSESRDQDRRCNVFCDLASGVIPHPVYHFYWSHRPALSRMREDYTWAKVQGSEDHRGPSWKLITTSCFVLLNILLVYNSMNFNTCRFA